jgi:WD40 repeat protein
MGMDPVTPGGWNTYLPFGRNNRLRPSNAGVDPDWKQQWKNEVTAPSRRYCRRPCGTVELLASLATGHRGNVFHVTPFPTEPGSVLTCGADGCLRLGNLATGTASVVLHPNEARDGEDVDMPSPFMLRMAFSHVMVSPHTGLLCSERGLHRFDLRLSPRDQPRKSLLAAAYLSSGAGAGASASNGSSARRRFHSCKACAVWNPHALDRDAGGKFLPVEMESYYVFAGGASPTVGLFDVRMDASTHPRVVELYKPLGIQGSGTDVSVSGLDVSKNARELLVSYESDQIYAFPIAHTVNRNPTSYDIDRLCDVYSDPKHPPNEEMASYGGHLNRFTFLKNARYAGPDDEYIVTGSDSGHAWIFQRDTGTVVSLLGADSATCNGVVPHPNLPFFITYGIDSTAKLWRATPPVDPLADDSPAARADRATHATYEMSPVTKSWDNVQVLLNRVDGEPALFPDYIASPAEVQAAGRFSTGGRRRICASNDDAPHFGNALEILPSILRQNRYECYKSLHLELETIVSHKLDLFSHRVSISKMQHQADRLGLGFEPWAPWALRPVSSNPRVHPADLVPDWPSDWIVYVPNIMFDRYSVDPRTSFVHTRYEPDVFATYFPRFFDSRASYFEAGVPWLPHLKLWEDRHQSAVTIIKPNGLPREDRNESGSDQDDQPVPASSACEALLAESAAARPFSAGDGDTRRHLLFETARLLKEGGNEAMKAGLLDAAARRYDKAMQYCALAFMRYFRGQTLGCLTRGHHEWTNEEGVQLTSELIVVWSPLLHVLITSRLNLALILLRPSFLQPQLAAGQARAALRLLEPFSIELGKVIERHEGKADVILSSNEPASTYVEAKALQAKAYYRLGSAELEAGDYASAVKMFDASLRSSSGSGQGKDVKPDALTVKRLQEAKRRHMASKKRERAKYEKALFPS